ncbi:MAG TPA: choice-of-anchor tandem repeat GloVer-containing protein, partial [Candidatus Cybelea sp.]|nr:choice-of-anchor tandem repeat GloVer-containing protein [Candidatus Cybelea sp.]
TTGAEKVLYSFQGGRFDGATPYADLIDVKGTLIGTTDQGSVHEYGTVYQVSTSGSERLLHRFSGGSEGSHPWAGLVNVKGTLYGTTYVGGSGCSGGGCGTVFAVKP